MKYIKQKSTGKIVYREQPWSDKAMDNASDFANVDKSDLEVVEEELTEKQWEQKHFDQMSWEEQ